MVKHSSSELKYERDLSTSFLRRRGFGRGLVAGLVAHVLAFAAVVVGTFLLRSFVWHAISSEPYDRGPLDPNSKEWLFLQLLSFIAAIVAGAVVARWSVRGTMGAVATYATVMLALVSLSPLPLTDSLLRQLIWVLGTPLGVVSGGLYFANIERRRHEV